MKVAAPQLDSPYDGPVTYPGDTKILVKSSKGRSGPTLNTTTRPGLRTKNWETKSCHMECKGNCGENGGITNRTAEKEN